uniref:Uncharacterized protein n=1 Tax=Haptolina brevifila TaxID=156173 RepID=A0A7S2GXP1_9EUKA|mmetsp:Transcript_48746/g.97256  ORF Transcript_48746/g.97256 Transcript_48746/m.97256 type:complete len:100 (+) Transcript_48746:1-300(+)
MSSAVQDSQSQVSLQLARPLNAVRGAAMAAKHVSFDKYDEAAVHDFGLMGRCMMSTGRLVKGSSKMKPFPCDEHLDIACRWAFIPCYAIAMGIMHAQLS